MKKRRIFLGVFAALLILLTPWVIWENVTVGLTEMTLMEKNLPKEFDGLKIAHVSDLHNSWLWEKVLVRLKEADPDMICITGDMIDRNRTDVETALKFAAEAVKIAPCYYVTGNHEMQVAGEEREALLQGLRALGVTVLLDESAIFTKDGRQIAVVGHQWGNGSVSGLSDFEGYRILLSHCPEYFDHYAAGEYDLVLCGHVHGGQIRLPWIGALYAPGQGIFPEYHSGLYSRGNTDMIVSRGIGNSTFPVRFHNRPEVIILTLRVDTSV